MELLTDIARRHGPRLVKYAGASVVGIITGQAVLLTLYAGMGWSPVPANVVAVVIGTVPSYLLNRAWVWERAGRHSWRSEILPVWSWSFAGLALSTGAVWWVGQQTDAVLWVNAANIAAFGVLWLARYAFFDAYLFAPTRAVSPA